MQTFSNEEQLVKFAVKHYYSPKGIDIEEFYADLKRFKYVKRLVNRYTKSFETVDLSERLILNHLIIIFNVFGIYAGLQILNHKLDKEQLEVIKPFLVFLKIIKDSEYDNIYADDKVVKILREI